ncbi:MAG: glycosyltransferase family 4 protein [Gaiellaceae bacterium]
MRILIASDQWFPDFHGGSARVAAETARRLADRGHEVVVLVPRAKGRPRELTEGTLKLMRVLPRNSLPQTFTDVVATARYARGLGAPFDVLLGHQSTTASGLRYARLRAPLLRVFHASVVREVRFMRSRLPMGRERLMGYALEPALRAIERTSIRSAAQIVVLSEFSRSLLLDDFPAVAARIRLVRGGVDTDRFTPADGVSAARARLGLAETAPILFAVRRLEPRMGLEQLLHATARLVSEHDVQLALAGRGVLEARLRRLAEELAIDHRVRFLGGISEESLRDWYRAADLMVLPTVAYEGFGLVTAEALASGTPVVGTPVGATPELLLPLDSRLLATSAEPDALAAAIAGALQLVNPDFRRRCREYACAQLSWNAAMVEWEAALEEGANLDGAAVACERASAAV